MFACLTSAYLVRAVYGILQATELFQINDMYAVYLYSLLLSSVT